MGKEYHISFSLCIIASLPFFFYGFGRSVGRRWAGRLPEIGGQIWQSVGLSLRVRKFRHGPIPCSFTCFGINPTVATYKSLRSNSKSARRILGDDCGIPSVFLGPLRLLLYQHLWSCLVHSSSGKIWLHVFFWICSRSHVNCLGLVVSIFPEPVARESTLIGSDVTLRSCGKSAAGCGVGPKRSAHLR